MYNTFENPITEVDIYIQRNILIFLALLYIIHKITSTNYIYANMYFTYEMHTTYKNLFTTICDSKENGT